MICDRLRCISVAVVNPVGTNFVASAAILSDCLANAFDSKEIFLGSVNDGFDGVVPSLPQFLDVCSPNAVRLQCTDRNWPTLALVFFNSGGRRLGILLCCGA